MKVARSIICIIPVSQDVDASEGVEASAEAVAASDPQGLAGVADHAREGVLALRHHLARVAPNATVGDAASIIVKGDGTELVKLLEALARMR